MIHGCLLISMSLFITTKSLPKEALNKHYSSTVTVFFGFLNP